MRTQLRDAAQDGQQDEYGGDQLEDAAAEVSRRMVHGATTLLKQRKIEGKEQTELLADFPSETTLEHIDREQSEQDFDTSEIRTAPAKQMRIKTKEVYTKREKSNSSWIKFINPAMSIQPEAHPEQLQIKTKEAYIKKKIAAKSVPNVKTDAVPQNKNVQQNAPQKQHIDRVEKDIQIQEQGRKLAITKAEKRQQEKILDTTLQQPDSAEELPIDNKNKTAWEDHDISKLELEPPTFPAESPSQNKQVEIAMRKADRASKGKTKQVKSQQKSTETATEVSRDDTQIIREKPLKCALKPVMRTVKTVHRTTKKIQLDSHKITYSPQQKIKTKDNFAVQSDIKMAEQTTEAGRKLAQSQQAVKTGQKTTKRVENAVKNTVQKITKSAKNDGSFIFAASLIAIFSVIIMCFCGAAANVLSGEGTTSHAESPISEKVYAYQTIIAEYAAKHGISEYISLIEAVMMQESGGQGLDPMQASECGYNTKFANKPNAITDPVYSIDCGIHELADCLKAASVQNPFDLEHIKLALQGYNYGAGYISWALRKYGGYTEANAAEFPANQKAKLGVRVYGDPKYVPHVLRYYSYSLIGGDLVGGQMILSVAAGEIGYQEQAGGYTKYGAWFGVPNGAWCAMFTSWCAEQCGLIQSGACPKLSVSNDIMNWFKNKNQWYVGGTTPPAGAYIVFDWDKDGIANHIGFVEYVEDGRVHTIEGNSSNRVRRNSYKLDDKRIMGYGIPMM